MNGHILNEAVFLIPLSRTARGGGVEIALYPCAC